MSIQPGDVFLFSSLFKKGVEEHCIVVEIKNRFVDDENNSMWKIFVVETGSFDQEIQGELLRVGGPYRRVE